MPNTYLLLSFSLTKMYLKYDGELKSGEDADWRHSVL